MDKSFKQAFIFIIILLALISINYKIYNEGKNPGIRPMTDTVGFAHIGWKMDSVMKRIDLKFRDSIANILESNDIDSNIQKGYQWQLTDSQDFNSIFYDSQMILTNKSSYKFSEQISEGTWYWRVRTQDLDNDWGPFSSPRSFTIDSKTPISAPTIPINNGFYNTLNNISGIAIDPSNGSGINEIEISIKRLSDNYHWDGYKWMPLKIWLLANGNNEWSYDSSNIIWTTGIQYQIQSRGLVHLTLIPFTGVTCVEMKQFC